MGRYSSVQAYADSNSNMRTVSYQQATGSTEAKKGVVKTEKVSNPYGSTAGAGSGEFHTYRHSRAREMDRWKQIDEQESLERLEREFQEKIAKDSQEIAAKTDKNRRKRQRQKEAKMRKKNLQLSGVAAEVVAQGERKPGKEASSTNDNDNDEEEFTYQPASTEEIGGNKEIATDSGMGDEKLAAVPYLETSENQQKATIIDDPDVEERPEKRQAT